MSAHFDIAIIGAGAAGLAAGIFAAEAALQRTNDSTPRPRIIILDGAKTIGAKILVSGGGRCNVTHDLIAPDDFHGSRNIIRNVLAAFDEKATARWMQSLGVPLKREETGKLFPVSDSARTVLAALLNRLQQLNVEIRTGWRVNAVVFMKQAPVFAGDASLGDLHTP
ncbi:MAG TPA: NAD(P)/FAD-dependent oxidoreductase, partial [Tepidisphaeraceae bacterium]|nr:NAD(P)/FAD-dependent oxidoreductase [Tepidisphaeraceae bacterium]